MVRSSPRLCSGSVLILCSRQASRRHRNRAPPLPPAELKYPSPVEPRGYSKAPNDTGRGIIERTHERCPRSRGKMQERRATAHSRVWLSRELLWKTGLAEFHGANSARTASTRRGCSDATSPDALHGDRHHGRVAILKRQPTSEFPPGNRDRTDSKGNSIPRVRLPRTFQRRPPRQLTFATGCRGGVSVGE